MNPALDAAFDCTAVHKAENSAGTFENREPKLFTAILISMKLNEIAQLIDRIFGVI